MSERVWRILIESFPKILLPGLRMTLPLTVIAFSIAMVIAVIVAMVQYAHVRVLSQVFRAYIWIIRGTPLLVQLFVVFYGLRAGYYMSPFCMSYTQIMRRIVLPQALRTAFPPLSNSLISMVKDTSLASNITVAEMFMATQRINARYYEPLALYLEVAVIYLIFCTLLTWLQRLGEKKLSAYTKKEARHA